MCFNDESVLCYIVELLNQKLLTTATLRVHENAGLYNSIQIHVDNNPYRNNIANDFLFARIHTSGKRPYIAFNSKYTDLFALFDFASFSISSEQSFTRIDLKAFLNYANKQELSKVLTNIFLDSFKFPSFGCCSLYEKCSKAGHCLHADLLYATACMYRKNLEQGRIFY